MATRIQIRRDTATNWSSANTILAQGEMALETDTGKLKVGDGTTAWGALDYSLDPVGATGRVTGADASNVSTKLYSPTANVVLEPGTGGTVVANGNMTVNGTFNASDMGTFVGSVITDNTSLTNALQQLETAVESAEESSEFATLAGVTAGDTHLGTFTGSTISDNGSVKAGMQELETSLETKTSATQASLGVDHLITLSGVVEGSDNLGAFSGSTIADNSTIKASLQALETAVESAEETSAINSVYTGALGLSAGDAHFGTFSGSTITDNRDAKEALQELETAVETKLASADHTKASLDVDHLITLSGVSDASDDLGTFSGATIADNETIKGALQDLETAVELNATLASDETITGNYTFNELITTVGLKSSSSNAKIGLGATTNEGNQNIVMSAGENIHFISDRNNNDSDGSICFHFNEGHATSLAVADSFWKMDETGRFGGKDGTSHIEFPSWTTTERDNGSFGAGAVIFNSTVSRLQLYDGTTWRDLH